MSPSSPAVSKTAAAKKTRSVTARKTTKPKASTTKSKAKTASKKAKPANITKTPVVVEARMPVESQAVHPPQVEAAPPEPAKAPATDAEVAQRAFEIWVEKGRPYGQDAANWAQALEELGR